MWTLNLSKTSLYLHISISDSHSLFHFFNLFCCSSIPLHLCLTNTSNFVSVVFKMSVLITSFPYVFISFNNFAFFCMWHKLDLDDTLVFFLNRELLVPIFSALRLHNYRSKLYFDNLS